MNSKKINVDQILFGMLFILGSILFYLKFIKKDTFQENCKCKLGSITIRTDKCKAGDEDANNGCGKLIENGAYVCIDEGTASPCE
jgi:hypothetical protein